MKNFPKQNPDTAGNVQKFIRYAQRERKNDVNDFDNLKNKFFSGRKVEKIPTGSSDVTAGDVVGDISYDASYVYILVNNGGTAEWRRAALGSW